MNETLINFCWLLCLTIAALEDLKTRQISLILLLAGTIPGIWNLCRHSSDISAYLWAALTGIFMLILSRITEGALGEGDGYFFLFSALYLDVGKVTLLFLGGLVIGCIWGIGLFMHGRWRGNPKGLNASIPFLACVWPVGVWMVFQ